VIDLASIHLLETAQATAGEGGEGMQRPDDTHAVQHTQPLVEFRPTEAQLPPHAPLQPDAQLNELARRSLAVAANRWLVPSLVALGTGLGVVAFLLTLPHDPTNAAGACVVAFGGVLLGGLFLAPFHFGREECVRLSKRGWVPQGYIAELSEGHARVVVHVTVHLAAPVAGTVQSELLAAAASRAQAGATWTSDRSIVLSSPMLQQESRFHGPRHAPISSNVKAHRWFRRTEFAVLADLAARVPIHGLSVRLESAR
jgi:hypothetical protein